jgi:predicted transcriptional regulator
MLGEQSMESLKVVDYINKHPVRFKPNMPVAEAVELLLASKQSGGPVIDDKGKLIGFLSEQDCLMQMLESTYYRQQVATVYEIMSHEVHPVNPNDSILELTQRFIKERYKLYPVINDNGELLGTINRSNILYAIDIHLKDGFKQ